MSTGGTLRPAAAVLAEAVGHLAFVATNRLYDEQPDLWDLGENGRARTLEDFTHHLRLLATLSESSFRDHVEYSRALFEKRGFPLRWLDDAWRTIDAVLRSELPAGVHEPALALLHAVVD